MRAVKAVGAGAVLAIMLGAAGCTSIRETRGYIVDDTLIQSIQPGIDNRQSVEATLGRPSFTSEYGDPTWYYVSSTTKRRPFGRPRIGEHQVLAVEFDGAGNVLGSQISGLDRVVYLDPDSDETPTLGRERGFLEDLFGNIGAVGTPGLGSPTGGPGTPGG
jgi:outer membrane protein assembly factor BamE (lipoprotein component of BamABCDE complex)